MEKTIVEQYLETVEEQVMRADEFINGQEYGGTIFTQAQQDRLIELAEQLKDLAGSVWVR